MRDGWRNVALREVVRRRREPVSVADELEYTLLGIRWKHLGAYKRGDSVSAPAKAATMYRMREGDFAFNRIDTDKGAFAVVGPELDGALASNEFPAYRCEQSALLASFLWLHFQRPEVFGALRGSGSEGRARWKEADFEAHRVWLPPLAEQRRIVDLIGALDDAIEAAVFGARSAEQLARKLRDRQPDGAASSRLGDVLTAIQSGVSTRPVSGPGRPVNMLTLAAIRPARFYPEQIKSVGAATLPHQAILRDGDLLVTRSNTPDRVGYACVARDVVEDTYLPDLVWRLVPNDGLASAEYLSEILSSTELRRRITGSASGTSESMRKINKAGFSNLAVPIPTLDEQERWLVPIRATSDVQGRADESIGALQGTRANLLTALLSGEHEIPESYDELLEAV